jgi:hypothetical protein
VKTEDVNGQKRLVADDGKWLTDGNRYTKMVTVGKRGGVEKWEEVDEEDVPENVIANENRRTGGGGQQDQGDTPDDEQDKSEEIGQ